MKNLTDVSMFSQLESPIAYMQCIVLKRSGDMTVKCRYQLASRLSTGIYPDLQAKNGRDATSEGVFVGIKALMQSLKMFESGPGTECVLTRELKNVR